MYKATLWLAGAQHSLRYRQQTAASSHRFGLCLGSWLAPSGIFLSNNVVDELRLSARLALLGILFKDGRRGAVVRWLSPLYCSFLLLPPFPSASLNSSGTWSGQNCAPHPKVLIKKKKADSQDKMDLLQLLVWQSMLRSINQSCSLGCKWKRAEMHLFFHKLVVKTHLRGGSCERGWVCKGGEAPRQSLLRSPRSPERSRSLRADQSHRWVPALPSHLGRRRES